MSYRGTGCLCTPYDWIGTGGAGFGLFENHAFAAFHTGIQDNSWSVANAMLQSDDGAVWIGGAGERPMVRYQNGRFEPSSSAYQFVHGFAQDRQGTIWAATQFSGLLARRSDGTEVGMHTAQGLPTGGLSCIILDSDNSLWIGTIRSGLCHYVDGKVTTYTTRDGLPSNDIVTLHRASDGALWVLTAGGAIATRKGDHFKVLFAKSPWRLIGEDREGLVFADQGDYARLSGGKFVPMQRPKQSEFVFSSFRDAEGNIWFTSSGGLVAVRHNQVTILSKGLPTGTHVMSIAQATRSSVASHA